MQRTVLDPLQAARALPELWSPRVIAELDENYIVLTDKTRSIEAQLRP